MMSSKTVWEIARLDGQGQAALVRKGEVAPGDLVGAAIAQIEALDPSLNCVSWRAFDHAREALERLGRSEVMCAVPYLLKDSLEYPNMPVRSGSRARRNVMGRLAYPLARRFDEAGLVPIGKSTMPEFGLLVTAETLLQGPTRNPWNLETIAGGSSSGAAVAVAAGMVPFAHASDAGGSIRTPASNCGIIGFKPSRGWNVRARAFNLIDDILCSDGLYSRSMRDTAWAARWLRPGDRKPAPHVRPRLRIACDLHGFDGLRADDDVCTVIEKTAKLCADLGHHVEDARQPIDGPGVRRGIECLWSYLGGEIVDHYASAANEPIEDLLEPFTLGLARNRADMTPEALAEALAMIERASADMETFHDAYDVVLSPVLRSAPPRLGVLAPTRPFKELLGALFDYVNYTPLQNIIGAPSISLPLFSNAANMPIGSLFSAWRGEDETLLALASELEAAAPWADRWPPIAIAP